MSDTQPILINPPKKKRPRVSSVKAKTTDDPPISSLVFDYHTFPINEHVELETLQAIRYIIISIDKLNEEYNAGIPLLIQGNTINSFVQEDIDGYKIHCKFKKGALLNDYFKHIDDGDKVNVVIVYNIEDGHHGQTKWVDAFSGITYHIENL